MLVYTRGARAYEVLVGSEPRKSKSHVIMDHFPIWNCVIACSIKPTAGDPLHEGLQKSKQRGNPSKPVIYIRIPAQIVSLISGQKSGRSGKLGESDTFQIRIVTPVMLRLSRQNLPKAHQLRSSIRLRLYARTRTCKPTQSH